MARGQVLQAPYKEVHKLHPADCPDRPSLDADQRRRSPNISRHAEGRFQQEVQRQVLPFPPDHSHDTTDYYDLKQQIEALIRQGKL